MANGTSTPVLAAVPRPGDIVNEIRSAYSARENLRALLARVRAARNRVDADLVAVIIRDFGGPRPDGAFADPVAAYIDARWRDATSNRGSHSGGIRLRGVERALLSRDAKRCDRGLRRGGGRDGRTAS